MLRAAGGCQEKDLEERRNQGECGVLGSHVWHPHTEDYHLGS